MSYTALYRKYRPQTLDDVIGQESVVQSLRSRIDSKTVPHAILLTGTRGVGKTSLARIIARSMNIDPIDVFEIDAASYRKVEDARRLRDEILTVPIMSTHKVYILDEVHMLTNDSWNTLLKSFEEPPKHIVFILATTELDAVPETILSRCMIAKLSMPRYADVEALIQRVAKGEGYTIDEDAMNLLVIYADGAYRNALVGAETVFGASSEKHITGELVAKVLSMPTTDTVRSLLVAIDTKEYEYIQKHMLESAPASPEMFVRMMIEKVRLIVSLRFGAKIVLAKTDKDYIEKIAGNRVSPVNAGFLMSLIQLISDMRKTGMHDDMFRIFLYTILEGEK
jgi:DNA polymerase-3 subunit gamma/tau